MWKPGEAKPKAENVSTGGLQVANDTPKKPSKKRLSGATMNMRFMQRKGDNATDNNTASTPTAPMEIEEDKQESFSRATPVDMYGASLTGRRSFGGFNGAMEEAWKGAQASIENRSTAQKEKISDEELLQRYQDVAQKRREGNRPIGNLEKAKKRTRRK